MLGGDEDAVSSEENEAAPVQEVPASDAGESPVPAAQPEPEAPEPEAPEQPSDPAQEESA